MSEQEEEQRSEETSEESNVIGRSGLVGGLQFLVPV